MDTLGEGVIHALLRKEWKSVRFYQAAENMQRAISKRFASEIFHLTFSDCGWLCVSETMEIETQSKGVPLYTLIFYVWCFLNVTFCHFSSLFCFGLTPTHIHTFIPPVLLTGFCSPLGYCPRCLLSWKPFCSFSAVPYPAVPLALLTFSVLHCGS